MNSMGRPLSLVLAIIISCVAFSMPAVADEEGRMPLSRIQFDSAGLDNSGPVHVEVTQSAQGVTEMNVSAFGSLHKLPSDQLSTVKGLIFNTVGVTYSRGYAIVGGRSVYILLCQGFSSGASVLAIVTVKEKGASRIKRVTSSAQ